MSERTSESESLIFHRQVEPDTEDGGIDVVYLVAEIEGKDPAEMPSLYRRIDHLLEKLFSNPPDSAAQVELSFSYAGYRINVDQSGDVRLMRITGA